MSRVSEVAGLISKTPLIEALLVVELDSGIAVVVF